MAQGPDRIIQHHNTGTIVGKIGGDFANIYCGPGDEKSEWRLKDNAKGEYKKLKGTWENTTRCDWLIQSPEFRNWSQTKNERPCLWVYGKTGSGKSTLMSRVIDHVSRANPPPQVPSNARLLYCYVDYGWFAENDATKRKDKFGHQSGAPQDAYRSVLVTLWQQTVANEASPKSTLTFDTNSSIKTVEKELLEVLMASKQDVYIVIDALDQLPPVSHTETLDWLDRLAKEHRVRGKAFCISLALSSRDKDSLQRLTSWKTQSIEVTHERNGDDIESYLKGILKSPVFEKNNLLNDTATTMRSKAGGMFLWAKTHALNIAGMKFEKDIRKAVQNLDPSGELYEMYKYYASGFETLQGQRLKEQVVHRTVALLTHMQGSVSKDLLLIALSINHDGKVDKVDYMHLRSHLGSIISACSHLVEVNENIGVFRFCHGTAYKFFQGYNQDIYHQRLGQLCLTHICSSTFSSGPRSDATWFHYGSLGPVLREHPFLEYASHQWFVSIKNGYLAADGRSHLDTARWVLRESEIEASGINNGNALHPLHLLFDEHGMHHKEKNLQLAFQIYLLGCLKRMPNGVGYEHILSYFGLAGLWREFWERAWLSPARTDDDGLTPIHWAIRNQEISGRGIVSELIHHGAQINAPDNKGRTPLYYASDNGNGQVLTLLLDKKVNVNAKTGDGETALIAACRKHHEGIIEKLIEHHADVGVQSPSGTALQAISHFGCIKCARPIFKAHGKAPIVEDGGPFGTSLHAAAFHGHVNLVKLFFDQENMSQSAKKRLARAKSDTYGSPLTAAIIGCSPAIDPTNHAEVCKVLLGHGAKINDSSGIHGPALCVAADRGHVKLVQLLLDKGAKVKLAKGPMGTAYQIAETLNNEVIKDLLKKSDAKAPEYKSQECNTGPQDVHRFMFRTAVKLASLDVIDNRVVAFEEFIAKEINKGDSATLRVFIKLGGDAFQDVISLAISSNRSTIRRSQRHDKQKRAWMPLLSCFGLRWGATGKSQSTVDEAGQGPARQDTLDGRFPRILNRMTEAAVKVLECAIKKGDASVIEVISTTWVETLNTLLQRKGFGESMLRAVVQQRADELRGRLTDTRLQGNENVIKTKDLAEVGIQLLVSSITLGTQLHHLSTVLSQIWMAAVNDVADVEDHGTSAVGDLIDIMTTKFSRAVDAGDQLMATSAGHAGTEMMKAAASTSKWHVLVMISERWARQWMGAMEHMHGVAVDLIKRRRDEYKACITEGKHHEALDLALVLLWALRAAVEQRYEPAVAELLQTVEMGLQWTAELHSECTAGQVATPTNKSLGRLCDMLVYLLSTTERIVPGRLDALGCELLRIAGTFKTGIDIMAGHIQDQLAAGEEGLQAFHQGCLQLDDVCITVVWLLDSALRNGRVVDAHVTSVLRGLGLKSAEVIPDLLERVGFSRFDKALAFLQHSTSP